MSCLEDISNFFKATITKTGLKTVVAMTIRPFFRLPQPPVIQKHTTPAPKELTQRPPMTDHDDDDDDDVILDSSPDIIPT